MSQRGLEMPHSGGRLFRFAVAVEQREVAGRENLFGIVFAEIGHGVCIAEGKAKFLVLSRGGPYFFHQAVRRGGVLLQFRGYLKRRDPVHLVRL